MNLNYLKFLYSYERSIENIIIINLPLIKFYEYVFNLSTVSLSLAFSPHCPSLCFLSLYSLTLPLSLSLPLSRARPVSRSQYDLESNFLWSQLIFFIISMKYIEI